MRVRMIFAFALLVSASLVAQTFRGTILGTVTDASGAVVSGANIAVKNVNTIINGHSPTTMTVADLRQYSEFIADFVKFVQDAKKAGKTIDDVVSTWKTPAKYAGYGEPNATRVKADAQVIWDETK